METLSEVIFRNLQTQSKERFRPKLSTWALASNQRRLKLALDLVDAYPNAKKMNDLEYNYSIGRDLK